MAQLKVVGKASKVGQTAQLKRLPNGRTVADARTPAKAPSKPVAAPKGKAAPVVNQAPQRAPVKPASALHCPVKGCRDAFATAAQLTVHMKKVHGIINGLKGQALVPASNGQASQGKAPQRVVTAPAPKSSKPEPLEAASLKVGQKVFITIKDDMGKLTDQCVVKVAYPAGHKGMPGASVYLEGIKEHVLSGLYYDGHLEKYKATLVTGR